jgi:hypothetical protein
MSNPHASSDLEEVIVEVKEEFRVFLTKRRDLVIKLGTAYEKVVTDPASICEEIKNVLHDEISQKLISGRNIERYCPDKWKKKTKPKNDKMSFSSRGSSRTRKREEQQDKMIMINAQGTVVTEPIEAPIGLRSNVKLDPTTDQEQNAVFKEIRPEKTDNPDNTTLQLDRKYDKLSRTALLDLVYRSQKELNRLKEIRNRDTLMIDELKAALAATSFTSANKIPQSTLNLTLDLEKFGSQLFTLIQNKRKSCSFQVDQSGTVLGLNSTLEENNNADQSSE